MSERVDRKPKFYELVAGIANGILLEGGSIPSSALIQKIQSHEQFLALVPQDPGERRKWLKGGELSDKVEGALGAAVSQGLLSRDPPVEAVYRLK